MWLARFVITLAVLAGAPCLAQPQIGTAPVAADTYPGLEALLDETVAGHLERTSTPGATVSIVANGRIVLSKGYGLADVATGRPVDPERTLFRTGSISKIFTAIAAMQLVEAGKLDLDADVNTYLDRFRVPQRWPDPVTLRSLLTHSSGFEESVTGTRARTLADIRPLGETLAERLPARMFPPGQLAAYTNFNFYLAGHLVERGSGLDYHDYLDARIFAPLGMVHSTSRQDMPPQLLSQESTGYAVVDGVATPQPFDINDPAPAGGVGASGGDMGRFILALLDGGQLDGVRLLNADTLEAMMSPQFANHPSLGSIGFGFWIDDAREPRTVGHGGQTKQVRAEMVLLPEHEFGVFAAVNSDAGRPSAITDAVLERYFPDTSAKPAGQPVSTEVADALIGPYRAARFGLHGPLRFINVMRGAEVTADEAGAPQWRGRTLLATGPDTFVTDDGRTRLAMVDRPQIGPSLTASEAPVYPYFKRTLMDSPDTSLWALIGAAGVFGTGLFAWPLLAWLRRKQSGAGALALVYAPPLAAMAIGGGVLAMSAQAGMDFYYYGPTQFQKAVFALPYLAAGLLLIGVASLALSGGWRKAGAIALVHAAPLTLAAVTVLAVVTHWNLAGWWL